MKHLAIKIGKAWSVLQRDGFIRGGRRIMEAAGALFQEIPEGEILLVSGGVGDSARYRTVHVAEELVLNGFRAVATVQDNPQLLKSASRFRVVVLHRTPYTPKMAEYLKLLKQYQATVLFETDDLVYDPQYLRYMDYYTKMNSFERKLYENGVGGEILADSYVEYATTSTHFLKRKLEEKGKKVFLISNKLSQEDELWGEEIRSHKKRNETVVRMGYLSGTPSHNKDFATIKKALLRILKEFGEVELVLAGPLDTDDELQVYTKQIIRVPFAPRKEFFKTIASLDINLAPLEIDNPFCEAKSELKFFEAGLLAVPTVAVANETYRSAITDGTDGFLAATEDEWYEKIKILVTDTEKRKAMGEKALQTTLTHHTTKSGGSAEYYQFLREHIV